MATIQRVLGRVGVLEQRHGNGAFTAGRRRTDPQTRLVRVAEARLDAQAERLAAYKRIQFPK